jgi:mono/diheme cytochrome c family protein
MTRWLTAAMVLCLLSGGALAQARPGAAAPRQDYSSGEYLYRAFCASCHGPHGAGDGMAASILRVPPPNLTTIALRHRGEFPAEQVSRTIDGRRPLVAHGPGEMPIWGDVLKITEGQSEAVVARRIFALVTYVESLQAKPQ